MDAPPLPWLEKLRALARSNRPSQKPQLWENLPLALRRRVKFEISRRVSSGWLDQPQVVDLSQIGFDGRPGLRMEIVPREFMNQALFLYGTVEISETRLVQAMLRPGMCFVDVGANIGYYTVIAARLLGPSGTVHSFEPNASVRSSLVKNLELNAFHNVVVHDEAVTSESGSVLFYKSEWTENSGISSILPGDGRSEQGERVPSVSLDDFAEAISPVRIDLLKIDIEGAELDAIKGGERLLSRADAPAILFESFDVGPSGAALDRLGYDVRRVDYSLGSGIQLKRPDVVTESVFSSYEAPNYVAVKDRGMLDRLIAHSNAARLSAFKVLGKL
jgi:FkbM family methyltransferase